MEVVRAGALELPALPPWSASQGPLQLGDWLLMVEPIVADLSATSEEWWRRMTRASEAWYNHHMSLAPLERLKHEAAVPREVSEERWQRLERRMASMMLQAVPEVVKEELVSSRRLSVFAILTHLMLAYAPGGISEKQQLLKNLEEPAEIGSIGEAPSSLRRWMRWKRRTGEIGAVMPDPALLMKGLNKMVRRLLEGNKDLQFRVSLARNALGVDMMPTEASVTQFATHLLAELEQLSMTDKRNSSTSAKPDQPKIKSLEAEAQEKNRSKPRDQQAEGDRQKCKFFLSEGGCRKGKECKWAHDQRDDRRRCYNCGAVDHMSNVCTRPKGSKDGSPKAKTMKGDSESSPSSQTKKKTSEEPEEDGATAMKDLLEEASRMLKSLSSNPPSSSASTASVKEDEEKDRKDVVDRLQQQLKALRVFRIHQFSKESSLGLVDSGATHCLRPVNPGEDIEKYVKVMVSLADGNHTRLHMSPGGAMVSEDANIEPILPMGMLVNELKCQTVWSEAEIKIWHPVRGNLDVKMVDRCPHLSRALALDLIAELEDKKRGVNVKRTRFIEEEKWMKDLVEAHPILRKLPQHVRDQLVVSPGSWNDLPGNRRQRKRWQRDGLVAHLFAGPDQGFTLGEAWKQMGGDTLALLEVDILRGAQHDMLADQGSVYPGLLRAALEGNLNALVGGPNCRTRSVLRHFPIEGVENPPRPLRRWGGEEYGIKDLTPEEEKKVKDDDVMLWRMIFIMIVATQVRKAMRIQAQVGFELEQPSSPRSYQPDCVCFWDTTEWQELKKELGLSEVHIQQNKHGASVVKPTTFGGNLNLDKSKNQVKASNHVVVKSSKDLARWPPGVMTMIAQSLIEEVQKKTPKIHALSWKAHLENGHAPYRRDCLVCQQAQQQAAPHRRVKWPRAGVLSLDVTGPLVKAYDAGGAMVRYALVGAMTWAVPAGEPDLKDAEFHEEPLPEGAPEIEEEKPEAEEEEEGEEGEERGGEAREWVYDPVLQKAEDDQLEEAAGPDEVKQQQFYVKTFRMITTLKSKKASEVARGAMELILRLKADGYGVYQLHCDQGHEFKGAFSKWANERGYKITRTAGDNPQQNGRVENAVKCIKTQIRRTLVQGGVGPELWPWALKYVNEVNRCHRIGRPPDWPLFNEELLVRKRTWVRGDFRPTPEFVRYLTPSPENHGHWVRAPGKAPRLTRYYMTKGKEPTREREWVAIEREALESLEARRRMRGKTAIKRMQMTEDEKDQDQKEKEKEERRIRILRIIEEEIRHMIHDDPALVAEELKVLKSLKREGDPVDLEEEEILQTKIVSPKEVVKDWNLWKPAVEDEIRSLLQEKLAMKEISREGLKQLLKEKGIDEKKVQYLPSKCVFTKKPGKGGGKLKMRWVVCGNFEVVREGETNFSSGADSAAFRVAVATASREQWEGGTVDVKTAFLNADMKLEEGEDVIVILAPSILIERKALPSDRFYIPLKAVYGFRRSPRLWGNCRDETLVDLEIPWIEEGENVKLQLDQLLSEQNLWRIQTAPEESGLPGKLKGLIMTYVDDMFVVGVPGLVEKVMTAIQEKWKTSPPDSVSEVPIRFLGMEVTKHYNKDTNRWDWMVTQASFLQDLINQDPHLSERKIPITKELSLTAPIELEKTAEEVRLAQKAVGELLWVVTRTRVDMMYTVARMGSQVLRSPSHVLKIYKQALGYLKATSAQGLLFAFSGDEPIMIESFSDASFSPEGEESHGAFIVKICTCPILWRSGKQSLVTLSTAESELVELVESIAAGESVAVIAEEILGEIPRRAWTDSQSAVAILATESTSWRTRHLKMRSASARTLILTGAWSLQHMPGEKMPSDMGTKPLTSSRLEMLKKESGMTERSQDKEKEEKRLEEEERKGGTEALQVHAEEAKKVLKILAVAAALSIAKGEEDEVSEEDEARSFEWILVFYTILVIVLTLVVQKVWKVAVGLGG